MNTNSAFVRPRVLLAIAVAALAAGYASYVASSWEKTAQEQYVNRTMSNFFMSLNPITRLDSVYTDADGDLLADTPENAALQVKPTELVFSFITSEDSTNEPDQWQELMDAIAAKTGIPVTYLRLTDSREQYEALRNGRLHITALGTGEVPAAVNTAGFIPVCTFGREDGTSGYTMEFIVKEDSPIKSLDDLREKTIAFTRPRSNSGCKAAAMFLMEEKNLQPELDYQWSYTYGHQGSIDAVLSGEVDAAPIASDVLARMIAKGEIPENAVRSIYQSEKFPPAAFGIAYNLTPETQEAIRQSLLEFNWEGTKIAAEFGAEGTTKFVPIVFKDDWALVRHVDLAASKAHADLAMK
ncbi:phosphate/phosphite/phosphonate ABC transporter substrate-binding protein [Bythopirellula polymerisocia]|uniref:Phosphate-import protein PhnD n=1 Tax=Bythopirellula polymerisocia TaxID=2528003 RepID=A0A5C6D013_9BACT|nr:phosphate/phosphite/phosphonate ABC transporter substrate-binding protein [Bythopirellula polymerisocia]TWU28259.1 Phosphate-import protein PhnD precursor [Bythopirellula polymerisocia]